MSFLLRRFFPLCWFLVFSVSVVSAKGPDLVLLKRYSDDIDPAGWLMSEKLDGVRAFWDGQHLLSRGGNVFAAPAWFVEGLPPFAIDGELWTRRADFARIQSVTSRDEPHEGWRTISYNIFEVPSELGFGNESGLLLRLQKLQRWLVDHPASHLRVIEQIRVRDRAHLKQRLDAVIAAGGEGLVLRKRGLPYRTGRDASSLKVKVFEDAEAVVVAYRAGKGRLLGKVGALQLELPNGRRFYVGSGMTDARREAPPKIGESVTFRYQGWTKYGLPRFPVFLRVRVEQ